VDRRIGLSRNDEPVFTDTLRPLPHALLDEMLRVLQQCLDVLGMLQQPAGLLPREDVGDVSNRRQRRMQLRNDGFVRVLLDSLARKQRHIAGYFGGYMSG
jgi:hypothetical protein